MLELPRVTAICYDGRPFDENRKEKYHKILNYQNKIVRFNSVKIFLTYEFNSPNIQTQIINRCDINDYSDFCLYSISKHFDTDYVLIFQDDGFVLNHHLWDDEFFNYDYIGAPWPYSLKWNSTDYRVGNGGFSLRSRALCEFSKNLPESKNSEDAHLCVYQRRMLNDANLKVAPVSVARKFSVERSIDDDHTYSNTFGFHGVHQHDLDRIFSLITS
jgi:hypothetical protein